MENGRHGNQEANSQWPNIQISSKYMKLCVYQIWCLYHKMNNMLAMPPHYLLATAPTTKYNMYENCIKQTSTDLNSHRDFWKGVQFSVNIGEPQKCAVGGFWCGFHFNSYRAN